MAPRSKRFEQLVASAGKFGQGLSGGEDHMSHVRKYQKRSTSLVGAVRLDLDTNGFSYQKWGHEQRCKAGDWLVDNDGEVYTVDADAFASTYCRVGIGQYRKVAPVWAEQATSAGVVQTKEGATKYEVGDYLVSNSGHDDDRYAVARERFEAMYEEAAGEPKAGVKS